MRPPKSRRRGRRKPGDSGKSPDEIPRAGRRRERSRPRAGSRGGVPLPPRPSLEKRDRSRREVRTHWSRSRRRSVPDGPPRDARSGSAIGEREEASATARDRAGLRARDRLRPRRHASTREPGPSRSGNFERTKDAGGTERSGPGKTRRPCAKAGGPAATGSTGRARRRGRPREPGRASHRSNPRSCGPLRSAELRRSGRSTLQTAGSCSRRALRAGGTGSPDRILRRGRPSARDRGEAA